MANEWNTMSARNAVSSKMAECYVTFYHKNPNGDRYNFMSAINVSVNFEKDKSEVPILGRMNKGHKSTGGNIAGSAEFHLNTSIWRELAYLFQETGEDFYFDMEIINEDPTTNIGRQGILLRDCNWDTVTLAAFDADSDDVLTESIDFTAESFEFINDQKFKLMDGMM